MHHVLIIDNVKYHYKDISLSSVENKLLIYNVAFTHELYSKHISELSTDEVVSVYYCLCNYRTYVKSPMVWFDEYIGLDKLPQEYKFMEL